MGEIKYENGFELKIRVDIRLSQLLVTQDRLLLTIPFLNLCCITSKYWFLFKIDCFVSAFYSTFLTFLIQLGLRPRRITSSEISIIFHIIRKPNSIIVILFIQNNSQFENIAEMFSSSSLQCPFRVVQLHKYSPNSRCRPLSCLLAVLPMFLAIISPISYS